MTTESSIDSRYLSGPDRNAAVAAAAARGIDELVRSSIVRLNSSLPRSAARDQALAALGAGPVAFVATGQQLGLFGGALLTLYKAITAVRAAAALSAETGATVLPLFWLQGDDHDLKEVERFYVPAFRGQSSSPGGHGPASSESAAEQRGEQGVVELSLSLAPAQRDAHRISVAEVRLPARIPELLSQLRAEVGSTGANVALDTLEAEYAPGRTMQQAFLRTMALLLAELPLLFFDSRDPLLGPLRVPFFLRAFDSTAAIEERLNAYSARSGSNEQVMIRPGSPLFFLHPEGQDGPRFRVERSGQSYRYIGRDGSLSETEVREFISTRPAALSTSALLRPLLQDALLPVAGYVGGAAELQYLRQIAELYQLFDLPRCLVIPRARFLLTDSKLNRLIEQLGLTLAELESGSIEELFDELLRRAEPGAELTDPHAELRAAIDQAFETRISRFAAVDPSLTQYIERTRERVERSLDGLGEKYRAALERRYAVMKNRLVRAHSFVRPLGEHQERVFGWTGFVARHGMSFISAVEKRIEPFSSGGAEVKQIDLTEAAG